MLPISLHFLVSVLTWCPPSLASCLATISAFSPLTSRPSSPPAFLASSRLTLPPSGLLPRKRPRFPRVTAPPRPAPRRPPPSPWPTTKTRQNLAAASACHSNCKYVHEDYCRVGTSQRTVKTCSYCKSCPKFHRKFNVDVGRLLLWPRPRGGRSQANAGYQYSLLLSVETENGKRNVTSYFGFVGLRLLEKELYVIKRGGGLCCQCSSL